MNKKNHFIIIILLLITTVVNGQDNYNEKIVKSGNEIAQAMINNDYETIADLTYPKIIELMGGKEQMIKVLKDGMIQMENQGIKFSNVTIGKPQQIFKAGGELHCLVPQKIIIFNGKGKVINDSYLLAISKNNGGKWYFLDTSQLTNENANELFPEFNKNLKIPEKTKPKFESN